MLDEWLRFWLGLIAFKFTFSLLKPAYKLRVVSTVLKQNVWRKLPIQNPSKYFGLDWCDKMSLFFSDCLRSNLVIFLFARLVCY